VIYVIKKDEILLFLRDLAINPRIKVDGFPMLIFCDNEVDDERFSEFFDDNWEQVTEIYNEAMEKLNKNLFDPIFLRTQKSGLIGDDMISSVNSQIDIEICKIKKEYGSFEEYIARLMLDEGD
jgi:hypothetical protein